MTEVMALSPTKEPGEQLPEATTYYGYNVSRNLEATAKTMTDVALHRTADEPSPWLQCFHGRHSNTTSDPVVTWPQDHDNSHAQTSIRR